MASACRTRYIVQYNQDTFWPESVASIHFLSTKNCFRLIRLGKTGVMKYSVGKVNDTQDIKCSQVVFLKASSSAFMKGLLRTKNIFANKVVEFSFSRTSHSIISNQELFGNMCLFLWLTFLWSCFRNFTETPECISLITWGHAFRMVKWPAFHKFQYYHLGNFAEIGKPLMLI